MVNAVTGRNIDLGEMLDIGERNYNLLKLGRNSKMEDGLPKRFSESLPRGASANQQIEKGELNKAIEKYYELRGWDVNGPTKKKLNELKINLSPDF